jgi:hypothetical protein
LARLRFAARNIRAAARESRLGDRDWSRVRKIGQIGAVLGGGALGSSFPMVDAGMANTGMAITCMVITGMAETGGA